MFCIARILMRRSYENLSNRIVCGMCGTFDGDLDGRNQANWYRQIRVLIPSWVKIISSLLNNRTIRLLRAGTEKASFQRITILECRKFESDIDGRNQARNSEKKSFNLEMDQYDLLSFESSNYQDAAGRVLKKIHRDTRLQIWCFWMRAS